MTCSQTLHSRTFRWLAGFSAASLCVSYGGPLLTGILVNHDWLDLALVDDWLPIFLLLWALGLLASLTMILVAFFEKNRSAWLSTLWRVAAALAPIVLAFVLGPTSKATSCAFSLQKTNQIKQFGLSMRNFALVHDGQFPPHRTGSEPDENGNFPHSWRVHLLPFLEQDELFQKIRLNEPWDSAWNRQFHDQMPPIFRNPEIRDWNQKALASGQTTFCVIFGADAPFPEDGPGPREEDFQDRASETILIAESAPGCWMDPNHDIRREDAIRGVNQVPNGLRTHRKYDRKICDLGMADGSVRNFRVEELTRERLQEMTQGAVPTDSGQGCGAEKLPTLN